MELKDISITKLPAVGPMFKTKFAKHGLHTVVDVLLHGSEEIHTETGMKKDSADVLVMKAKNYLEEKNLIPKEIMSVREILDYNKKLEKIPTGSCVFNNMLNGGFEMGHTYSIYGQNGSGKTQIAHNMAVEALQKKKKVLWLEIENTFRPERLIEMIIAKKYAVNEEEALQLADNIILKRCLDSTVMMDTLNNCTSEIIEQNVGLIIVDGAIGKFRLDFRGRGTLSDRQVDVGTFVGRLAKIAFYLGICVILTNQVTANLDPYGAKVLPIGGHIVGHFAQYIIYVKKNGEYRTITLKKSSYIPEHEINVSLTAAGFEDTPEFKKHNGQKLEQVSKLLDDEPQADEQG